MGRPRKPEHEKTPRVYPSGASKRRAKYELDDLIEEQQRDAAGFQPDDGAWVKDFKRAGKPDLENPETDLSYIRKLQLIVTYQMATTHRPPIAQERCWRRIKDMSATVGMTSSKAALESTVRKLRQQLEASQQSSTVVEVPGSSIVKPDTARGMRRGPRSLTDDPTLAPKPPTEPH